MKPLLNNLEDCSLGKINCEHQNYFAMLKSFPILCDFTCTYLPLNVMDSHYKLLVLMVITSYK